MKGRILLIAVLVAGQMLQTGCWDYREYEDMALVTAIGIDFNKETRDTTITVEYTSSLKPKGGQSGGQPGGGSQGIVFSATDKTFFGALTKIQEVVSKQLFFGYLKMVVVSADAAKYRMLDIVELLDRSPAIRSTAYLVVTSSKAEDVLSTYDPTYEESSSEEIAKLIRLSKNTGASLQVSILNFEQMLAEEGIEPVAPRVVLINEKKQGDNSGGTPETIRSAEKQQGDQRIDGLAVFRKEKLVGWLGKRETRGFRWITGRLTRNYETSITVPSGNTERTFYYRVSRSIGKIKVKMKDGKPTIQLEVKLTADLRKYFADYGPQTLTEREIKLTEKKLSESVRLEIDAALKKAQKEYKSDIFGFGFALFRKNPKLWHAKYARQWDRMYPEIPVQVNIQARVINTGTNLRRFVIK